MVNIIKQEVDIEEALKKKLEFVCSFCNTKCEKQKGKNRDITSYERKLFNERVKGLKQEISNLQNEVSNLEDNKESINKQITKLLKIKMI